MGDLIAMVVIAGFPIGAVLYGAIVIADDECSSDYSDTFLGGK